MRSIYAVTLMVLIIALFTYGVNPSIIEMPEKDYIPKANSEFELEYCSAEIATRICQKYGYKYIHCMRNTLSCSDVRI